MEDSFVERERRIKLAPVQSSSVGHRRFRRRRNGECGGPKKEAKEEEKPAAAGELGEGGEDEAEEVERRVRTLQRLVPGGEEMGVDRLLEETAEYIEALQEQVNVMRALATFLDVLEKEKRMMGG